MSEQPRPTAARLAQIREGFEHGPLAGYPSTTATEELLAEINALREERDEARAAIAQIHQHTGRGDGHGSVTQTTLCILDEVSTIREDVTEAEQERDTANRCLDVLTKEHNETCFALERAEADLVEANHLHSRLLDEHERAMKDRDTAQIDAMDHAKATDDAHQRAEKAEANAAALREAGQAMSDAVEDHLHEPFEDSDAATIRGAQGLLDAALATDAGASVLAVIEAARAVDAAMDDVNITTRPGHTDERWCEAMNALIGALAALYGAKTP